jgi:hypothetical protein
MNMHGEKYDSFAIVRDGRGFRRDKMFRSCRPLYFLGGVRLKHCVSVWSSLDDGRSCDYVGLDQLFCMVYLAMI